MLPSGGPVGRERRLSGPNTLGSQLRATWKGFVGSSQSTPRRVPGRRIVHDLGMALLAAMQAAQQAGNPTATHWSRASASCSRRRRTTRIGSCSASASTSSTAASKTRSSKRTRRSRTRKTSTCITRRAGHGSSGSSRSARGRAAAARGAQASEDGDRRCAGRASQHGRSLVDTRRFHGKEKSRRSDPPAGRRPPKSATHGKTARPAAETSARSTVSGPSRRSSGARDAAAAKQAATELVAEAFPFNAAKPTEYGSASAKPQPAAAPSRRSSAVAPARSPRATCRRRPGSRRRPAPYEQRAARARARRLLGPRAHDQPGRADRRQPELAEGGPARPDAARGLHPAREDHALRPRAHSRAHRARARLGRARLLRVLRAAHASSRARRCSPRPASARRCSCASPPWRASAAPPTPRATCAASP